MLNTQRVNCNAWETKIEEYIMNNEIYPDNSDIVLKIVLTCKIYLVNSIEKIHKNKTKVMKYTSALKDEGFIFIRVKIKI